MRVALRVAAVGGLFVAILWAGSRHLATSGPAPGDPAPAFEGETPDGHTMSSSEFAGRLVVLNFWATWCAPCVAEMPSLENLHRALGSDGLVVLGVSVDEDGAELRRFVAKYGLTLPILRDPGGRVVAARYGVGGYPETFVIGADGVVRDRYEGPARWDTPEALDHFRGLLAPRTAPTR